MSAVERCVSFSDLHRLARRRLPRILFDSIESGVEDEIAVGRNERAFRAHVFVPRLLLDVERRDLSTRLFDRTYAAPFGMAPTGLAGLYRRDAEPMLARAAATCDVPFILSGASIADLEEVAAIAPQRTWYQVYAARDAKVSLDLARRAHDAGITTLVITVDGPVYPKRERDLRNGFGMPMKAPLALKAEALRHPAWLLGYAFGGGVPMLQTWRRYAPEGADAAAVFAYFRTQSPSSQTWRELDMFRRAWPGRLVVKGVQHPDDAIRAAEAGCDGVIVSNHGGKVLDRGLAAIEALPPIVKAVGHRISVMMDSGVRRGSDIVVARCLGARFVFVGRAPLYGVIAAGQAGAERAMHILRDEVDRTLALIGCPVAEELGPHLLLEN